MSQSHFSKFLQRFRSPEKKALLNDSDVFCMASWVHVHVLPHGKVFPCCASGHLHEEAIGDLRKDGHTVKGSWNSPEMKKLRKDMLSGKQNKLCERCHKYESLGKKSERSWFNTDFERHFERVQKTLSDGTLLDHEPVYLDIRFSNRCNLRCRICLHELSSAWYNDSVRLGLISEDTPRRIIPTKNEGALWRQLSPLLANIERIHFAGGGPLVMDEHYQVLQELLEKETIM